MKKGVLRNFAKFTGKYLCRSLFFNKAAGLEAFIKKRFWHRCFPVNFAKFLRTLFSQNTSRKLLASNKIKTQKNKKKKKKMGVTLRNGGLDFAQSFTTHVSYYQVMLSCSFTVLLIILSEF